MSENESIGETLMDNAIYLILFALFFGLMLTSLWLQMNGGAIWGEYYSKELTKIINLAEPGDQVTLNIQKPTELAYKNKLSSFSEIFTFDNSKSRVCVKLSQGRATCYHYFNNVIIINQEIKLGVPQNILTFTIAEKPPQKNE